MTRVSPGSRDKIPPEQMADFDYITGGLDRMVESSPAGMMLNSVEACKWFTDLKRYLRDDSTVLPSKIRELAMLLTAREMDSPDVWNLHAASGRQAGLSDELVDALRDHGKLPEMSAQEKAVVQFGRELFRTHRVSQDTFQAALDQFGVKGLVELTMLTALYAIPSFIAHAFEIHPPADTSEPLLPVKGVPVPD